MWSTRLGEADRSSVRTICRRCATAPQIHRRYPNPPTLILSGDHLDRTRPKPFGLDGCKITAQTPPNMTVWWLPDLGINGNSHMMAMDTNNRQVFEVIKDWIETHALP